MKCDQCDSTTINGVFCHELGCPDSWLDVPNEIGFDVACCKCDYMFRPLDKKQAKNKYRVCDACLDDAE